MEGCKVKKKQIILLVAGIFLSLLLGKLLFNFIHNENLIKKVAKGNYETTDNGIIYTGNIFEPYIAHYNNGNVYYKRGEYERAMSEYQKALKGWPPKYKECKIRINLVLALLNRYDWSGETIVDAEALLEDLKLGRAILLEDGCATDFNDGHDVDAQTLKNDIDKLIEELEQQIQNQQQQENQQQQQGKEGQAGEGEEGDDNKDEGTGESPEPQPSTDPREKEIQDQLDQYRQQSEDERGAALQDAQEYDGGMYFGSWGDKIW